MRFAITISTLTFLAAAQTFAAVGIPKASRDDLQALSGQVASMQERVNGLLAETGGVHENDSRARKFLLEFSQRLERLTDNLDQADANWDQDYVYGQWIKRSCLETRRLFVINSQGRRAAGEPHVGQIQPHNPIFDLSAGDIRDIRDTVYCSTIEQLIDNQNHFSWSNWNSSYNADGQKVEAWIELQGGSGQYKTSGFTGYFKDMVYFEDHISARWEANGSSGWLELPVKGHAFSGFWGRGDLGSPIGGEWSGNRS